MAQRILLGGMREARCSGNTESRKICVEPGRRNISIGEKVVYVLGCSVVMWFYKFCTPESRARRLEYISCDGEDVVQGAVLDLAK